LEIGLLRIHQLERPERGHLMSFADKTERFCIEDYLTWPEDERWEIIDGRAYDVTPAPTFKHQKIVGNIYHLLRSTLRDSPCVVGIAPTDIILSEFDVVQPDVFVVCDERKITDQNIRGAPDLVVEVLSPATSRKDRWEKKALYGRAGVFEYILVDPEGQYVERYLLEGSTRFDRGEVFTLHQVLCLESLESVELPLWEMFGLQKPA
jgi:Uma2 family endonuclease